MEYHIYKQLLMLHLRKVIFYNNLRLYPWLTTNAPVEELLPEFECNSPAQYLASRLRYVYIGSKNKQILFQNGKKYKWALK